MKFLKFTLCIFGFFIVTESAFAVQIGDRVVYLPKVNSSLRGRLGKVSAIKPSIVLTLDTGEEVQAEENEIADEKSAITIQKAIREYRRRKAQRSLQAANECTQSVESPAPQALKPLAEDSVQASNSILRANDQFIRIELNGVEDDLDRSDWIKVVDSIASGLETIYHPMIAEKAIQQFKDDMFADNGFSLLNLRNSIRRNFGVGHLGVTRAKVDVDQVKQIIQTKHPEKTQLQVDAEGYNGKLVGYLYDPTLVSKNDLRKYQDETLDKLTLKLLKTESGEVPIITVPAFDLRNGSFVQEINEIAKKIGRNYERIILDLRGNSGGNINGVFYLLSLFLGNNDPDIYPIGIDAKFFKRNQVTHEVLERALNNRQLLPFYEATQFGTKDVTINKDVDEKVQFKKMVVLVDGNTFSGGEISAATLKNTLGSKVCILGTACRGSFEQTDNSSLTLPHNFRLYLPTEGIVFYSKKFHKLLTGQKLLPDIEYKEQDTIFNKAVEILNEKSSYPDTPSYQPIVQP